MNIIEIPTLSSDMTLEQWLIYWFDTYVKRNVKRSTAVSYLGMIKTISTLRSANTGFQS